MKLFKRKMVKLPQTSNFFFPTLNEIDDEQVSDILLPEFSLLLLYIYC